MFALSSRGGGGELLQRGVDGALVALGLPLLERLDPLALDLGVGGEDAAVLAGRQRRVLALGELVLADDGDLAALDLGEPLAVRLDQLGLHVRDGLDGAAVLGDRRFISASAPSASSSTRPSITFEPSKMSG